MKKSIQIFVFFLTFVCGSLVTTSTFAQSASVQAQQMTQSMTERMNLDTEQVDQVQAINMTYATKLQDLGAVPARTSSNYQNYVNRIHTIQAERKQSLEAVVSTQQLSKLTEGSRGQ